MQELEAALQARLLHRTTRSVSLTEVPGYADAIVTSPPASVARSRMPRRPATDEMMTIDPSRADMKTAAVVFDSATHL